MDNSLNRIQITKFQTISILMGIGLFTLFLAFLPAQSHSLNNNVNAVKTHRRFKREINPDYKNKLENTNISFIEEHLAIANKYRALHGSPPLEIDYKLAVDAENYAKVLAEKTDSTGRPYLNPSLKYLTGESLFAKRTSNPDDVTGIEVAKNWYGGCSSHGWSPNQFKKESARFSQLVWKDSDVVGIGKSHAPGQRILIVVARYLPAGNMGYRSSFETNVFPQVGKSEKCNTEDITGVTIDEYPKRN